MEVMRICHLHIEIAYMLYNLSFRDLSVFLALSSELWEIVLLSYRNSINIRYIFIIPYLVGSGRMACYVWRLEGVLGISSHYVGSEV